MASPERTQADEGPDTLAPKEWHERRLARPAKEGALSLLVALLDGAIGLHLAFHAYVFFLLPLRSTANVMGRFPSPANRDWWLGSGGVSRRALAWHVSRELLACSALQAVALVLVRSWRLEEFEHLGLSAQLGALPAFGLLFLLQLSLRSALCCVRHLGTCTWVPSALRATANGFRTGPAWTWALLQYGLVMALLCAPIALGAISAQPGWYWSPTGVLYPLLQASMVASSEAIQSRLTASVRLSDLFRWPRLQPARSARFAPRVGLLWTGSKQSVRVLALLLVLGSILGLALEGILPLIVGLFAIPLVLISGFDTPFLWKSEDSQAAYLHAAGIDHVFQRRAELLSGALLAVATFGFSGWLLSRSENLAGALVLLPLGSQLLLRSARGPVLGASTGRELAPVLFVASYMLLGIVLGIARGLGVDWRGQGSGAIALGTILTLQTAVLTLWPIFLWWGAWRSTRDEGETKAAIHG